MKEINELIEERRQKYTKSNGAFEYMKTDEFCDMIATLIKIKAYRFLCGKQEMREDSIKDIYGYAECAKIYSPNYKNLTDEEKILKNKVDYFVDDKLYPLIVNMQEVNNQVTQNIFDSQIFYFVNEILGD